MVRYARSYLKPRCSNDPFWLIFSRKSINKFRRYVIDYSTTTLFFLHNTDISRFYVCIMKKKFIIEKHRFAQRTS